MIIQTSFKELTGAEVVKLYKSWIEKSKVFLKATEEEIEEAGGRPIEPEAGGVLSGYKKVETFVRSKHAYLIFLYSFNILIQ